MKKTYFLYLILFIAVLVFAMLMVGCVGCFFDVGSLIMVVFCTVFILKANYSFAEMGKYFSCGFSDKPVPPDDLKKGIIFFSAMQKYLFLSGGIGAMMGLIGMLAMLDDPDKIGQGLALTLITLLYAMFFTMTIALPFRTGLEKRLTEA